MVVQWWIYLGANRRKRERYRFGVMVEDFGQMTMLARITKKLAIIEMFGLRPCQAVIQLKVPCQMITGHSS